MLTIVDGTFNHSDNNADRGYAKNSNTTINDVIEPIFSNRIFELLSIIQVRSFRKFSIQIIYKKIHYTDILFVAASINPSALL